MSDNTSLVGKEISGCVILQKVAEGGMGAVYKARHKALNRIVCVKILSPSLANDKKAVELFLTEARAIAEIDHPNIVNVYNVGREQGYYFIVMSFIEGETLSQIIKKKKVLPLSQILELFEGVLLGLDAAHNKGIIHRDIKPSNILVTKEGQAKIVDFGIAKKMEKDKTTTKTTELAGTAYFIAPEQALGRDLDTRVDLYSVGASLYYVLTGQFPYRGKNTIDIIQKHINDPIPDPAAIRHDLPVWLSRAVQKLMAKTPEARFQTAKEAYLFFQRMRAEEQLKMEESSTGRIVNLAEEQPLRLVQEEKFQTTTALQQQRALEKEMNSKPAVVNSSDLPVVLPGSMAPEPKKELRQDHVEANKPLNMQSTDQAKKIDVYQSRITPNIYKAKKIADKTIHFLLKISLLPSLLAVIIVAMGYIAYMWGKTASIHVVPHESFVENLVNAVLSTPYAPGQFTWMALSILAVILSFTLASAKAYGRSTIFLLFTIVTAFLAGLFAPNLPFWHAQFLGQFLFSPEYNLAYLLIALLGSLTLCFTLKRSIGQGILGVSLCAAVLVLTYLSTHLTIAPSSEYSFMMLPYLAILAGLLAAYYLISPTQRDSAFMPMMLLFMGVGCLWVYGISGLHENTIVTLETLTQKIQVKNSVLSKESKENKEIEKTAGIDSKREVFSSAINQSNEVSTMKQDESIVYIERQILRIAGEDTFNEEILPIYSRFLRDYYKGGAAKMNYHVWLYALGLPIDNFNENAVNNDVYTLLLVVLFLFAVVSCIGTIVMGENL